MVVSIWLPIIGIRHTIIWEIIIIIITVSLVKELSMIMAKEIGIGIEIDKGIGKLREVSVVKN